MSDSRPVVLVACGDPGGGSALLPVLEALILDARVSIEPYAYVQSFELLKSRGLLPREIPEGAAPRWFDRLLARDDVRLVLVATSHNGRDHEKAFVAAARRAGVPSLALLDFWSNYAVRFSDDAGRLVYVPDRIAVMDTTARDALLDAGIASDVPLITGHPGFDALAAQRASFGVATRERVRACLGVPPGARQVLFVSQPLAALYGSDSSSAAFLGYHEQSVIAEVLSCLEDLAFRSAQQIVLAIRLHPREPEGAHSQLHSDTVRIVFSHESSARDVAMASDLVVGMSSMLLVEAACLGCRVVSLQPGRTGSEVFPPAVAGMMRIVDRWADIEAALASALSDTETSRVPARMRPGNAAEAVKQEIYRMVFRNSAAGAE